MQNLLEVDAEAESLANDHVPAAAESDVQLALWEKTRYYLLQHISTIFQNMFSKVLDNASCNQVQQNYHAKETFSRHFNVQDPSRPK